MDTLKMRFKLHAMEFEIEGKEETVKKEFADFKEFITGQLLSKINIVVPEVTTITREHTPKQIGNIEDIKTITSNDYPVLKEVVKKDLPKSETDWILVYGFYASDYGENPFSDADINKYYGDTGRKNTSRIKNLSNNIKGLLNKNYIKMHNDTEYILKEDGIKYARQILQGNSTSKGSHKQHTSKPVKESSEKNTNKKNKPAKKNVFVDLNLSPQKINLLKAFFAEKKPKTQNEQVAVVMKWFKDDTNNDEISLEEINYLLSLTSKAPSALGQVLINMGGSGFHWVNKGTIGKYKLSSIGEAHVSSLSSAS